MRLFAAIPVPESLRQRLHCVAKELFSGLDEGAKVRITPPENIHLTLARIRDITRGHELTSAVRSATNTPRGEMAVRALKIYRSQRTRRGAHYTVLQEYLLTEGESRNG